MAQITYTNKVALNENPEIANINKVTDDDMNEIKKVVNDNYNNTIQITDTEPTDSDNKIWIDTGEVGSAVSEITNEYSTSTGLGYSCNYVNNMNTYSTDEVRVGTWIDGKPLYRATFYITDNLSTPLNYVHNINNIGYCDCHVVMITNDISVAGFYASSTDFFRFFRDGGFIKIRYGSDNHPTAFVATLEYTKTTD